MQRFLRAAAANGREVVEAAPFTAYLDREDPLKYLNYAVPDGDVVPAQSEIEALRQVFRERERLPRLEWIEEWAPRLAPTLADAGMLEELHTPLMTCGPDELVDAAANVPDLSIKPVDDGDLHAAAGIQRAAFGQPPLGADEPAWDPRAGGGGAVIARSGGEAVSAGAWTAVIDGVSEVAGVATAEQWRRRGLAGAVTAAAAGEAFAAGAALCVISPGDEGALRVYERAGFRRIATMLHWSDEGAV